MKKFFALVLTAAMLLSVMVFETSAADGWDGTAVATEFAGGDGTEATPYVIMTGAQLKYLSNQVAGGETYAGKYFVLGDDINLNNQEWTPIGGSAYDFAGNFDGKGYTVSGIKISNTTTYKFGGLFGIVRGGSYFKNLVIANSAIDNSNVSGSYAGAAAGYIDVDMISSIVVKDDVTVSSTNSTGGVFGRITGGMATYIVNYATVTGSGIFGGGISGALSNGGTISFSVNHGNVYGTGDNGNTTDKYFGGIIGLIGVKGNTDNGSTKGGSIINCYNDGNVSVNGIKPFVAGIAGRTGENQENTDKNILDVSKLIYNIEKVYNLSTVIYNSNVENVSGTKTASRVSEIIGQIVNGDIKVSQAYSVNVANVDLIKHQNKGTVSGLQNMTEAEIKVYTDAIDEEIQKKLAVATYTVTFDSDGGSEVPAQTVASGKYATKPADPSKDGYTLEGWYNGDVKYNFDDKVTAHLTLTAHWEPDTPVQPTTYTVTVANNIQNGTVEADKATAAAGETVTLMVTPAAGYEIESISVNGTPISGTTFTMPAENVRITAAFKQKVSESLFASGSGTATDPYVIKTAAQLAKLSEQVAGGESYAGKYFVLGNDIDLNDQEWTPIGPTEKLAFKGNFDGQGHTVSGIKISNTASYGGLFGYVVTDGYFKNLVIAESEIRAGKYAGAAAASIRAAVVSSIVVKEDVMVSSTDSTGGVFGRIYGGEAKYIVNYATVIGVYTSDNTFAGGICGVLGDDAKLSYSANCGDVIGNACINGGIVGFVGTANGGGTISNCYNNADVKYEYLGNDKTVSHGFAAGIIGRLVNREKMCMIEHTYNLGSVSKNYMNSTDVKYKKRISEVIGQIFAGTVTLTDVYSIDINGLELVQHFRPTDNLSGVKNAPAAEILMKTSAIVAEIEKNIPGLTCTVTFVFDNGSTTKVDVSYGEKATMPADPTKDGYTFKGWYNGTEAYNFDALVDKDLTLIAEWEQTSNAEDNIFSTPLFALAALYAQRYDVQLIGENCTVSGDTTIKYKRSGTVEISVAEGYEIVDVVANGEALGPVTTVTFKKVTRNPELFVLTRAIEKTN